MDAMAEELETVGRALQANCRRRSVKLKRVTTQDTTSAREQIVFISYKLKTVHFTWHAQKL